MKKTRQISSESGIAMLMAIFTLLLLTAMGLTLLCAADLETSIAANYRDKQVSMYGALSGLQEARDRLDPALCDPNTYSVGNCPAPAIEMRDKGLPSISNNSVVYILNPLNGETIEPWNPSNKYFDNELCKENILGLSPGSSATCPVNSSSVPSGSNWYTTLDDTQTTAGIYKTGTSTIPTPFTFKWVRITVKTDKMTPAYVSQAPTGDTVECWTGKHQVPATAANGYNADCSARNTVQLYYNGTLCSQNGTVCNISPAIGSGYVAPNVDITGGGGSGATATAHPTTAGGGQVTSITITNIGKDYTTPPTITIGGPGSGATATATIALNGAPVKTLANVTQTNPVGCYATTPSVTITSTDGKGSGATAVPNMTGSTCIAKWSLTYGSGTCTQSGTITVGSSGGGGTGFAGNVTLKSNKKGFTSYSLTNAGSGYTSVPTLTGLTGCTYTSTFTLGKQIQNSNSFNVTNGGSDYDAVLGVPQVSVTITAPTSPAGTPAPTTTATLDNLKTGYIASITVTSGGSGYTSAPTVTITGDGTQGAATASISSPTGEQIDMITLTDPGSGYTSNPTVSITGGSGATGITARPSQSSSAGRVFVLTAMAQAVGGSKAISQMEVATPPSLPFTLPGALTCDTPNCHISPSSSSSYWIKGNDANTCGETAYAPKASVGVTDNPDAPTSPSAVACVTSTLGGAPDASCPASGGVKTTNYTGDKPSPDVENVYNSLGDLTTPAGCDALATAISAKANYKYTGNFTCSSPSNCQIYYSHYPNDCPTYYIDGNLTVGPGGPSLCGVLLVTGTLTMQGDYTWDGPVFVIGKDGTFIGGGGGNGQINGSLFVAQDKNPDGSIRSTLGTPTISFDIIGGGGNGIQYDHCKSDNMLRALNLGSITPVKALQVLSVRTIY